MPKGILISSGIHPKLSVASTAGANQNDPNTITERRSGFGGSAVSASRHRKEVDALLWAVPEHPLSVECPWFILDEIHGTVQDGFRRLSRGGVEVGGVLFGRKTGNVVRILAWRPILCEHSRGPAFLLSNNDKQKLMEQLEAAGRDPHLQVLEPVGWFVSHTRAGLKMTEDDVETFQRYFPESWHLTLVYNPSRQGPTRAGFFVRDSNGRVLSESTYREFTVTNVRVPKAPESAVAPAAPQPQQSLRSEMPPRAPFRGHRRIALVAVTLLLGALALFAVPRLRTPPVSTEPVQLKLVDAQGQLRVEWNRTSGILRQADSVSLVITDGTAVPPIPLDKETLATGSVTYARFSEDVSVRFVVQRSGQPTYQEVARYVGSPVPRIETKEMQAARDGRARMLNEAQKLRQELQMESQRMRELERTVRKLQTQIEREARKRP
jgi:hypothetical protein